MIESTTIVEDFDIYMLRQSEQTEKSRVGGSVRDQINNRAFIIVRDNVTQEEHPQSTYQTII